MASDDTEFTDEPPRRRQRKEDEGPAGDKPREPSADEETGGGYDVAPLPPEEVVEGEARNIGERKRRKRSRSLQKVDEVPHPFTLRQGWLDGMFSSTFLPLTLAFSFFCFPLMIPVAVVAAIIAHDAEARRNALLTIGFCFVPVLVLSCVWCIGVGMNPR